MEESVYERKKRERKEEEDSWKEKKAWNDFKWSRGAGKRRLEQILPDGKRARLDLEDQPVMEDSWLGQIDLGVWLDAAEGICLRAGNLRSRLERDGRRVVRMMASLEQDKPILDIRNLWKMKLEEEREYTHLEVELGARHPINKPNTTPR